MKYDLRPENLIKLENVSALLTEEQKIALQWQGSLSNQAALARTIQSKPESARLGIMRSAMSMAFNGFTLFLSRMSKLGYNYNKPNAQLDLKPEMSPQLDMPRPKPSHAHRPRLMPNHLRKPY